MSPIALLAIVMLAVNLAVLAAGIREILISRQVRQILAESIRHAAGRDDE